MSNDLMGVDNSLERQDGSKPDVSMPLSVGDFGDDQGFDPLAGSEGGRRFSSGSILIVIVVGVAIAALVSMRTLARVTASVVADGELEALIENALKNFNEDTDPTTPKTPLSTAPDEVLEILKAPYSERQVQLNDVQKNPFIIAASDKRPDVVDDGSRLEAERQKLISDTRAKIERAGDRLDLKSVMMGWQPLANVSGKIVQVGDVIVVEQDDVTFVVKSVTPDEVVLTSEVPELELLVEIVLELSKR